MQILPDAGLGSTIRAQMNNPTIVANPPMIFIWLASLA